MGTIRVRARLGHWLGDPASAAALVLVAAWTPVSAASMLGELPVPPVGLLLLPVALVGVLVLRRAEPSPALRLSVAWAAVLGGALLCVFILGQEPYAALAAPALVVSAVVCSRYPAEAVVTVFLLTGTYGSLTAFTPVPVGGAIDALLAGLWLGAIWGYLLGADRRPVWLWPGILAVAAYVALTAFEVLSAGDREAALYSFRASAWYIAAFLLTALAPWPEGTRMRIAKGVVLTAILIGAYAAMRFFVGPSSAEQELALERTGNPDFTEFVGSFTSNKELAAWSSEVIPFCLALAIAFGGRWRLVAVAGCALLGLALVGADTRLQLVAVAGGVAVVLGLHQFARGLAGRRLGTTALATAAVVVIGLAAFGLATGFSEESQDRYLSLLEPRQENSVQARLHTWETVLDDVDEQPWGRGLGTTGVVQQRFGRFATIGAQSLDSGYLKVGLEQGLAVMVFFTLAMLALLYGLGRRSLTAPGRERAALAIGSAGALTSLLILAAGGVFIDGFTALAVWVMVGLGAAQFSWRDQSSDRLSQRSRGGRRAAGPA